MRDPILREAVPAPVYLYNIKLDNEFNEAILFDSVMTEFDDATSQAELELEDRQRNQMKEEAKLTLRLYE